MVKNGGIEKAQKRLESFEKNAFSILRTFHPSIYRNSLEEVIKKSIEVIHDIQPDTVSGRPV